MPKDLCKFCRYYSQFLLLHGRIDRVHEWFVYKHCLAPVSIANKRFGRKGYTKAVFICTSYELMASLQPLSQVQKELKRIHEQYPHLKPRWLRRSPFEGIDELQRRWMEKSSLGLPGKTGESTGPETQDSHNRSQNNIAGNSQNTQSTAIVPVRDWHDSQAIEVWKRNV